jgi:hypothetical protein
MLNTLDDYRLSSFIDRLHEVSQWFAVAVPIH